MVKVIYNQHPGRTHRASIFHAKVYNLQALCTKIRVYRHTED